MEGAKKIGEALKVNGSLITLNLNRNNQTIRDKKKRTRKMMNVNR